MNKSGKQEEEREEEERKGERKGVPHFSPNLREVGISVAHEERVPGQDPQRSHRNSIVIPTGASPSRRETEAEWRDLVSVTSSHLPF